MGSRVIVVANLEPRRFGKGLVSHGMVLERGGQEAVRRAYAWLEKAKAEERP